MIVIDAHLRSSHIGWINKLCNEENKNWKIIPRFYLNFFKGYKAIFKMNFSSVKDLDNNNLVKSILHFHILLKSGFITSLILLLFFSTINCIRSESLHLPVNI